MHSINYRKIGILALLGLLLVGAGCNRDTTEGELPTKTPEVAEQVTEKPHEPEITAIPLPALTLMESRIPAGVSGNVYSIPLKELETMNRPKCYLMGEKLLVTSDPQWEEEETVLMLKVFSLRNGELLATAQIECEGYVTVTVEQDRIAVCDSAAGKVWILSEALEVCKEYTCEADWENWYITPDFTAMYIVSWTNGVYRVELATGEKETVLEQVTEVIVKGKSGNELVLTYDDLTAQKTKSVLLDLEDGMFSELPYRHRTVTEAYREKDTWLFHDSAEWGNYYLYQKAEEAYKINAFEAIYGASLTEDGTILVGGPNMRTLYGQDGSFLSVCELTETEGYFCSEPVYSPLWDGYFFTVVFEDGSSRFMFWDTAAACEGVPLSAAEYREERPGGVTADAALYRRAKELSERFGVDIRIADECQLNYTSYQAEEMTDKEMVTEALDRLETALAGYPAGFFEQLCYGTIERVQIELVNCLRYTGTRPKEGGVAAFAQECGTYYLIVADVPVTYVSTYYHEISHVIDKKLLWDAGRRGGALFGEEVWVSYSPEEFTYAESYLVEDIPEQFRNEEYYAYFVSNYGMSYPTEDRATLMEEAMSDHRISFQIRPKLIDKMEYYSACIRDSFDTTGWPEQTRWEGPYVERNE